MTRDIPVLHLQEDEKIETIVDLNRIGARQLADDQYWCVAAPDGTVLDQTASKALTEPILLFCEILDCDWDDAQEEGFSLQIVRLT